jgi:NHLM bacteriocin system ABC transporter peptidase/ATP-binding protein
LNYGLKACSYRLEPEKLRELPLPVIIHWNFSHFVVLCGFRRNRAVLNDPARGRVEVTHAEFDKAFTGIVLRFDKGPTFQPEGRPPSVVGFAMRRLRGTLTAFTLLVLTGMLVAVAGMVNPLFSRVFLDNILAGKTPEWLIPFVAGFALVVLSQFAVGVTQAIYWLRIQGRFAISANAEFMWHVLRLPMEFFAVRFAGDIMSRQGLNQSIATSLFRQLSPVLINVGLLTFYLVVMLDLSVLLAAVGVAAVLLSVAVARGVARRQVNLSRVVQAGAGNLAGATMTGIHLIEDIKAGGAEAGFFEHWAGHFALQHNAQVRLTRSSLYLGALPGFLQQMAGIVILVIGVRMVLDGDFTVGMVFAFQGLLSSFLAPVNQLVAVGQSFISTRTEMERVEDVMKYRTDPNAPPLQDSETASETRKLSGALEIRNITFGYSRLAEPLIKDFSLSVKRGSSVAIVGASGSGKSTLAKLITGLYPIWSGDITFDDKPRGEIDSHTFRSSVAMVDQDITLFEDTVANNIRLWDTSIEDFAVILAARDADMHGAIVSRPDGFNHPVRENGKNFSGGERQRLEIARVLAQEPTLIVLDEATSALDTATEARVMRNIRDLGATCILIAHRLSTIRDCDEIVVLDRGRVAERGTHQELCERAGLYARLVRTDNG